MFDECRVLAQEDGLPEALDSENGDGGVECGGLKKNRPVCLERLAIGQDGHQENPGDKHGGEGEGDGPKDGQPIGGIWSAAAGRDDAYLAKIGAAFRADESGDSSDAVTALATGWFSQRAGFARGLEILKEPWHRGIVSFCIAA